MMTSLNKTLSIDLETYSSVNLASAGVYKYVESDDFEILLFAYSVDNEPVQVVDLASGEVIPPAILSLIEDETVIKYAFNAAFERICLSKYLGYKKGTYLNPNSWRCTMVWSSYLGLPHSLKNVGLILKIEDQKMEEGKDLIRYFCSPVKPTKTNGHRTRNYYYHDATKWAIFKQYNKRDVEAEMAIKNRLKNYPVPDTVWDEYHQDQRINDTGVKVDLTLVNKAILLDEQSREFLIEAMKQITELDNPNSVSQIKTWLLKCGIATDDLGKKNVVKLKEQTNNEEVVDALSIRQQLSKSSVKKYQKMIDSVCSDGRIRGMFMFYGANRTGRFSSKLVQLQNLPQNHLSDLKGCRNLIKVCNLEEIQMLYDDVPDTLSQLIRTAFIPSNDHKFIVADFSAIEARVIAWYSGEQWRLDAFANGEDIYCASASQMFKVPVVKHGINGELRQKGKIAELALGYGGSVGALKQMGALEMGLEEKELKPLVDAWRDSNPHICNFWWEVDKQIKRAISKKTKTTYKNLTFEYRKGMLFITLPSGRMLSYVKPRIEMNSMGLESITYEGLGATKKWERLESYGPKFVENIVQGTARDILCNSMKNLSDYDIVMHIHDEVVIDAPKDIKLETICKTMAIPPDWGSDLILRADGYECEFYQKD